MNKQQLRAQIAALQDATMDEDKNFRTAYDEGKFDALTAVDALLDSLQEEPVSEFLNIESMIESYKQRLISQANGMKNSPLIDMCLASYKHGINETLDTLNLSNIERTVKDWKEEHVSEDLEEAANDYAHDLLHDDVFETFIAGAQWQKGKTLSDVKKAVTGKVFQFSMKNVEARGDDPNGKTVTLEGPVTFHINNPESIIDALIAL